MKSVIFIERLVSTTRALDHEPLRSARSCIYRSYSTTKTMRQVALQNAGAAQKHEQPKGGQAIQVATSHSVSSEQTAANTANTTRTKPHMHASAANIFSRASLQLWPRTQTPPTPCITSAVRFRSGVDIDASMHMPCSNTAGLSEGLRMDKFICMLMPVHQFATCHSDQSSIMSMCNSVAHAAVTSDFHKWCLI